MTKKGEKRVWQCSLWRHVIHVSLPRLAFPSFFVKSFFEKARRDAALPPTTADRVCKKCKDSLLRRVQQEALLLPVAVMQGVRAPDNGFTARRIIGFSG